MKLLNNIGVNGGINVMANKELPAILLPTQQLTKENATIGKEEAFFFNPDASEFVPSVPPGSNEWTSCDEEVFRGEPCSITDPMSYQANPECFVVPEHFSYYAQDPVYQAQFTGESTHSAENYACHYYFPEPPDWFSQSKITETGNDKPATFDMTGNIHVEPPPPHPENVPVSLVELKCTPLYAFVGYSYTLPQLKCEAGHGCLQFKTTPSLPNTTSNCIAPSIAQTGFVPVQMQMMQPVSMEQQQQVHVANMIPVHSTPIINQVNQNQFCQTASVPPPTIPSQEGSRPGPCVQVFVPNVSSFNQNPKTFPSLIPFNTLRDSFR